MTEKPLAWLGSSLADVRAFPAEAKRAAGYQLGRVQQGLMPADWKPMTSREQYERQNRGGRPQ